MPNDVLIASLREKREAAKTKLDELLATPTSETRDLSTEEAETFEALTAEFRTLDDRIVELTELDRREAAAAEAAKASGHGITVREPLTYRKGGEHSYFLDLARATFNRGDADGARDRLVRHAREMDVEMPRRVAIAEERAATEGKMLSPEISPFEKRVNPNRTDGQGGYFVPPLWLIDEYIPLLRAGRVFADQVRQLALPGGTDSINLPKVATGAATNVQTADNAAVTSVDITDTSVSAPVRTIAGQQDIALQLLEQSPIGLDDQVIFPDLIADYNRRVDLQTLNGTGASGQMTGIDSLSGGNAVTYTDATPTGPKLYTPLAQVMSLIASTRFEPPTAIFMHPRRWFWLAAALDSQNRPLVVPAGGAFNQLAVMDGTNVQGPVGQVLGVPIFLDANIGVSYGAGTNEDRIYAVRTPDLYLWEGNLRARTLQEVLSGTLQVRLQIYNYVAFMPNRYPISVGQIGGTGLIAPAGF